MGLNHTPRYSKHAQIVEPKPRKKSPKVGTLKLQTANRSRKWRIEGNLTRHGWHGAGSDGLRRLLNLNKAHTAITGDRQPAVIAESRDVNAGDLTGLQHSKSLGDFDGVSIDEDLDGIFGIREVDTGPAHRGPRREICGGVGLGRRH